jgi:hypothetical protein
VERDLEVVVVVIVAAAYGGDEGPGGGLGLGSGGRRRPWLRGGLGFRLHLGAERNWVKNWEWETEVEIFRRFLKMKWKRARLFLC